MTIKNTLIFVFVSIILIGCENNPLLVKASDIQVDIEFTNIDEIVYYSDSSELMKQYKELSNNDESILAYEIGRVLKIGKVSDTAFYNSIQDFRADTSIQALEKDLSRIIPLLIEKEDRVIEGFRHIRYHFPEGNIPESIAYLNGLFTTAIFSAEKEIGVGTEWYMGDTSSIVEQLNPQYFFDWMKDAMKMEYYERDILTSWIETHYVNNSKGNLAENMVRWGKILYLVEASFPEFESNIILRYTPEDYEWAVNNELFFWRHLVDEKLLFKSDERTTRNMMNEGPFTPGLPNQHAPDRLGQFLGWRMVHRYMEKNEVTLSEMVDASYNEILQEYDID